MSSKTFREMMRGVPDPGDTPISHLEHTLAVYRDTADHDFAVTATSNVYGGAHWRSGLTWGDLRSLLALVEHVS